MSRFLSFVGCLSFMLFPGILNAEAEKEEDPVREVVSQQIEAFRKNDFKTAYGFAHSGVKEQFTQADFEKMLRGGFAPMLEAGAVGFGGTVVDGKGAVVELTITAEDGTQAAYRYVLEKENGGWKIAAVVPLEISPTETLV